MDEPDEIAELIGRLEFVENGETTEGDCSTCGRLRTVRKIRFRNKADEEITGEIEIVELWVCVECDTRLVKRPAVVSDEYLAVPVFEKSDWSRFKMQKASGEEFANTLELEDREFAKSLSSFLDGEVTLDDGKQHPMLESIAKQVADEMRLPTEKQRLAFRGVYDGLMKDKRGGRSLKIESESERSLRVEASRILTTIGMRYLDKWPGDDTKDVVRSMAKQFEERGILSIAQVRYLRFIVEQLPPALLVDMESV